MSGLDWSIVGGYVAVSVIVGLLFSRRAGKSLSEYFLSGRKLPWWVVGSSMVATTFAADTPLAVTEYVRTEGIWRNWFWWTLVVSHVLAAVVFSRLWRRAHILTDNELIEIRYHGKPAAILRGFKACYFSTLYNFIVMGWVTAAMSNVLSAFIDIPINLAVLACMAIALFYSFMSGFWGVVVTDIIQFVVAMAGSVVFAVLAAKSAGGMDHIIETAAQSGNQTLAMFPRAGASADVWGNFLVLILVGWWSTHNADGGGYIIQRMMSAKNERHALFGTFWFAMAHYVLRVWPWVVVALASMVLLPDLGSHTVAYPNTMARILPAGLRGLFVAVFLAAYMSTIDTHLNWGSSYIVNDIYKRFFRPQAGEKHFVWVSRLSSLILMIVAGGVALLLKTITAAWEFVYLMGAGVGAVLILRWFWWRINAWSEITGLSVSLVTSVILHIRDAVVGESMELYVKLLIVVGVSMPIWLAVTLLTGPEPPEVIERFCRRVRPPGRWPVPRETGGIGKKTLVAWLGGVALIYGCMFFLGSLILARNEHLVWTSAVAVAGGGLLWAGLRGQIGDQ